jgi:Rps23 Pro-64 3,4-dihydroxylase Tpa1-like proline 4-hydroxylase
MSVAELPFLQYGRLRDIAVLLRDTYSSASPFPHAVVDGLFDDSLLCAIADEFPGPNDVEWIKYKNQREVKLASGRDEHFGPLTRVMLYHLNSAPFLEFLSSITGIDDLVADSFLEGGGMHQIERGGKLGIHADFNKHPRNNLDRRLNVLLYLNKHWKDEYGGHLELWDREMASCVKKIAPRLNRMVIFTTTDFSYHGHPDELKCPADMTRKSLALYYYTNGRPREEVRGVHSTLFQTRPGEVLQPDSKTPVRHVRAFVKDILPPIVTRTISKFT